MTTPDLSEPRPAAERLACVPNERITIAVATRPAMGFADNGDAWTLYWSAPCLTLAVIDGVGHGLAAYKVAKIAVACLEDELSRTPTRPLTELMIACDFALKRTRGAAITLCRLDLDRGQIELCGVGNVQAQRKPDQRGFGVPLPGVVGLQRRRPRSFTSRLPSGSLIAMFSDGLGRFDLLDLERGDLQTGADTALARFGDPRDDATLLVTRTL